MVTMKGLEVSRAMQARPQFLYHEETMGKETDLGLETMHKTGKLAISPGLFLQEKRFYRHNLILRNALWGQNGRTNRLLDGGKFYYCKYGLSRSQWPRCLRHEPSSPDRTLGSWVRIPLNAWMSVCIYFIFMLFCVLTAALQQADPPSEESY
jgi:hypothetical protein